MIQPLPREIKLLIFMVAAALLVGFFLNMALLVMTNGDINDNREIGCISRYLDKQDYAPQCQPIIDEFKKENK